MSVTLEMPYAEVKRYWLHAVAGEYSRLRVDGSRADSRLTYIYAIGVPGENVKIGKADDALKRLGSLQTGNPEQLFLMGLLHGPAGLERFLHGALADEHLHGEWFRWTQNVAALIDLMNELSTRRP